MSKKILGGLIALIMLLVLLDACTKDVLDVEIEPVEDESFYLNWNRQHPNDNQLRFVKALKWGFSYMGAYLPYGSIDRSLEWESSTRVKLIPEHLGLSKEGLQALKQVMHRIQQSPAYRAQGGIDAGQFFLLTLNSSWHYYQIVGMPDRLDEFEKNYVFQDRKAAILESSISFGQRLIKLSSREMANTWAFAAGEVHGSIGAQTEIVETEVLNVMPNGHLRFGVYDRDGRLVEGANTVFSAAGKPGKCMWCHEVFISPSFVDTNSQEVAGHMSAVEFGVEIADRLEELNEYRSTLQTEIDFKAFQEHTLLEILYITYMEPSAYHLSSEWGMTVQEVEERLQSLETHVHPEFPDLGNLYHRAEVNSFSPFTVLEVPNDPRENNGGEPNFFN